MKMSSGHDIASACTAISNNEEGENFKQQAAQQHSKDTNINKINEIKLCTVLLERLSASRITEIQGDVPAYELLLNQTFPDSPYLRAPRRSKRRRTESGLSENLNCKQRKLMDFHEEIDTYKRRSCSNDIDSHSTVSDMSSGYGSIVSHPTSTPTTTTRKKPGPNNNNEYRVERIISVERDALVVIFRVRWVGWGPKDDSWEPLDNVRDTEQFKTFMRDELERYRENIDTFVAELKETMDLCVPKKPKEFNNLMRDIAALDDVELDVLLLVLVRIKMFDRARYPRRMLKTATSGVRIRHFKELRAEQLRKIAEWQRMVNEKEPGSKIKVLNDVDFEAPPDDFVYINRNIEGEGVTIPQSPEISCNCTDGCSISKECCGKLMGTMFAYRTNGSLRAPVGTPIYECNSKCQCAADCHNRVVQRGRQHKLIIYKTPDRGWGVRTEKYIPEGHFVCEYTGEVITFDETERRGKQYDKSGLTYLFDLDFHNQDNNYTIDALKYGNIARFINHSCDPNCAIWAMWSECHDPNFQRIVFFSLRPIASGEELTIDYLNGRIIEEEEDEVEVSDENTAPNMVTKIPSDASDTSMKKFRPNSMINKETCICKCGSPNCRKFIF